MKKFFKIFFISLGSLVLFLAIVIGIALFIVFTPERLTPIVRNQMPNFIICDSKIGSVELTFFSTFPDFELKIDEFSLTNPMNSAACRDALLAVKQLSAKVDIKALLNNNELLLSEIRFVDGTICVYIDSLGNTNFDIFPPDTTAVDTAAFELPFSFINISQIELKNINVNYVDEQSKMEAEIANLSGKIKGSMKDLDIINAAMQMNPFDIIFVDYASNMKAEMRNFSPQIIFSMDADDVRADLSSAPFLVSFEYESEKYLNNANISLNTLVDVVLSCQQANFEHLTASVNGLEITLSGLVENNDTVNQNIRLDVLYALQSWKISDLTALIPPSFQHYLDGISIDGKLSSTGKIAGFYGDSVMPLLNIQLALEDTEVVYPDMLPFPLHAIKGDLDIYTDLTNDAISYVNIRNFEARTPNSTIQTAGKVDALFSDPRVNLSTNANLYLAEFNPLIPEEMQTTAKGNVSGKIKTDLRLSHIEEMNLEKMKISGSLTLNDLDVVYDSVLLKTNHSIVDFELPNENPKTRNTTFVAAHITSDDLTAGMIDFADASLRNAQITLETSNVLDTTRIPAIQLAFQSATFSAEMDSMAITAENPNISVSVAPQRRDDAQPRFGVKFSGDNLAANMGDEKVNLEKLDVNTTVFYNGHEKDIFLQWLPRGSFVLENGVINSAMLPHELKIQDVKMDFNPREFTVQHVGVLLDNSDFNLSGKLSNILPYFRGDSILQGDFTFFSNHTDIGMLMDLTDGLGDEEEEVEIVEQPEEISAEPYMVPKGMDILLRAEIKEATLDETKITNINGDVRLSDGVLVLDGLTLTTPGADMQLTAMYRTPRKNHLFLGLNLSMLEIEIADLLTMIPDLDSIMPMLRSFGGKGEFRFSAQTNLDSLYNLKMSTLRAAASIHGEDLVLMDGETFSEISKKLRFNKKAQNKVDSLSAEFTVFRNEIMVFPFLIAMDKYKAVVGGRHNLDMSFEYNISLVESPLPFKASVNVFGDLDNPKFKLARAKYPNFYRPVARKEVESKEIELRELIRKSLTSNVAKKEDEE